jgi:predicted GNAT family acetyltransferase
MIGILMGYLASVLLAISLLVNNELKFRWLNMFGCLSFIIYGVLIGALPIVLTNAILLLINLFYLVKTYSTKEAFDLYEFTPGEKIINKFLQFYDKDIQAFFPGFKLAGDDNDIRFIVLRNMNIANIFVAELSANGTAYVKINYTVAKFRDYKVGTFIFEKEKQYLVSKGIKQIAYTNVFNNNHAAFLKKMGFEKQGGLTVKNL